MYAFIVLAKILRDRAWLMAASRLIDGALASPDGFIAMPKCEAYLKTSSLFHSQAGMWWTRALVERALRNENSFDRCVGRFVDLSTTENPSYDVTVGQASTLIGCAALLRQTDKSTDSFQRLHDLAQRCIDRIALAFAAPWDASHERFDPNFAHGLAGEAYALMMMLRWPTLAVPKQDIRHRLDELMNLARPEGMGLYFESRSPVFRASWCNGTSGQTMLWLVAYDVFDDSRYLDVARATAFYSGSQTLSQNWGCCCGLAGQAYALVATSRTTGEEFWAQRAIGLASLAAERAIGQPEDSLRTHSLFQGELGLALLCAQLSRGISNVAFPVYEDVLFQDAASF